MRTRLMLWDIDGIRFFGFRTTKWMPFLRGIHFLPLRLCLVHADLRMAHSSGGPPEKFMFY